MSQDYERLALLREQLARVESIVISWHRDLWNTNRRNYYVYADGAIEKMLKLRAEIDEILGIDKWVADGAEPVNGAPAEHATQEPTKS